jgi:hypothetical protein
MIVSSFVYWSSLKKLKYEIRMTTGIFVLTGKKMKKVTAFVCGFLLFLAILVPNSYGREYGHRHYGPRGGLSWGHHGQGWGWFLPGLIIGGVLGWSFSPYYREPVPVYPPAYTPPPTYYYPPPRAYTPYVPPPLDTYPPAGQVTPPSGRVQTFPGPPAESNQGPALTGSSPRWPRWVPGVCFSYSPRPGVVIEECHEGRWE